MNLEAVLRILETRQNKPSKIWFNHANLIKFK